MPHAHRAKPRAESSARQYERVVDFNAHCPVGTPVTVERDNGRTEETVTTSEAYMMSGHTAVVHLQGIAGCYALERVKAIPPEASNVG
jgi:hypothetical protein